MGFYGSINNAAKTQLNFDRVFNNRVELEHAAANGSDGVFTGNFALISYDNNVQNFPIYYYKNQHLYKNLTDATNDTNALNLSTFEPNTIISVPMSYNLDDTSFNGYLRVTDSHTLEVLNESNATTKYFLNYFIDINAYGTGRGYDGTIWQKTYTSNGEGFMKVGELNSLVPTFGIVAEPPSIIPQAPYIDTNSSNLYYKIHFSTPSKWWIKPASQNSELSTSVIDYPSDVKLTYPVLNESGNVIYKTEDGAVYFNADGFNPEVVSYGADLMGENPQNTISLGPTLTGKTGQKYSVDGALIQTVQPDVQEMIIMLPSVGDAIAQVWDLVYGGREIASIQNNDSRRNLDISWEDAGEPILRRGLRLTSDDTSGIGYKLDQVNTVAGSINTMHDLIGMIIVDSTADPIEEGDDASAADTDKIYWNNSTYYRVGVEYEPQVEEGKEQDSRPHFEEKDLIQPVVNTYFKKYGTNYILMRDATKFKKDHKYYRFENLQDSFIPVLMPGDTIGYQPNKYYYQSGTSFVRDSAEAATPGRKYYNLEECWHALGQNIIWFAAGRFYRKNDDGTIVKDYPTSWNENPNDNMHYNLYLAVNTTPDEEPEGGDPRIHFVDVTSRVRKFNENNILYSYNEMTQTYSRINTDIYAGVWSDDSDNVSGELSGGHFINDLWDNNIAVYPYSLELGEGLTLESYSLSLYSPGIYYYVENPITVTNTSLPHVSYTDTSVHNIIGDFVIDKKPTRTVGRQYFIKEINPILEESLFYITNEYYTRNRQVGDIEGDDGYKYTLSPDSYESNTQYYKKYDKHVIEDSSNTLEQYSLWNENIQDVPDSITLGWLKDNPVYKELEGYARDQNTLNGLILQTNKLLGEDGSRDRKTLKGTLNAFNDVTNNLKNVIPGYAVTLDDYGRFTSVEYSDIFQAWADKPNSGFSININDSMLNDYELDDENIGNIIDGDTVETAFNKIENSITYNRPYEETTYTEVEVPDEDPYADDRDEFWNIYHLWLNDESQFSQESEGLETYPLASDPQQSIDVLVLGPQDLSYIDNVYSINDCYYLDDGNILVYVGDLNLSNYDSEKVYYQWWWGRIENQFIPYFRNDFRGETYYTDGQLAEIYSQGEYFVPGTHIETQTETRTNYKLYDLKEAVDDIYDLQDRVDGIIADDISAVLQNDAIKERHIENGAVTEDKIADDAVTEDKIADDAISTDKIIDEAITTEKLSFELRNNTDPLKHKENLLNTLNLTRTEDGGNNIFVENQGIHLCYKQFSPNGAGYNNDKQSNREDTYFRLFLAQPLKAVTRYILSFDCVGVPSDLGAPIKFKVYKNGYSISSDVVELVDGRISISFSSPIDVYDSIVVDDDNSLETRPHNLDIRLTNFMLEEANSFSTRNPSLPAIEDKLIDMEKVSGTTTSQYWKCNVVNDTMVMGSRSLSIKDIMHFTTHTNGAKASKYIRLALPYPIKSIYFNGTLDYTGKYVSGVNFLSNSSLECAVGVDFRIVDDNYKLSAYIPITAEEYNELGIGGYYYKYDILAGNYVLAQEQEAIAGVQYYKYETNPMLIPYSVYARLGLIGLRATPPVAPDPEKAEYDATIGLEIANIAKSYYTALGEGRKFTYGPNFFYTGSASNTWINYNPNINYGKTLSLAQPGAALMECDTFAGLVLRGVNYQNSPYYVENLSNPATEEILNKTESYSEMMERTNNELPEWATKLRALFDNNNIKQYLFNGVYHYDDNTTNHHEVRFASDYAWLFWLCPGHLFTDIAQVGPGDVAFWRDYNHSGYFDAITHVAIVDEDGDGVYEITGAQSSNGQNILNHRKFSEFVDHMPCYFARPYGTFDPITFNKN